MQYRAQRHAVNVRNDKMLHMNCFEKHQELYRAVDSSFGQPSLSQKSKHRFKQILKNRQNVLKQYFPIDSKTERFNKDHSFEIEVFSKDQKTTKRVKIEDMDYFSLLKATGFIKTDI